MRKRSRTSGPKTDWVYRGHEWDQEGSTIGVFNGTYGETTRSLNAGLANVQVPILVDSQNYLTQSTQGAGSGTPAFISRAARPEGRRTIVREVQGQIVLEPNAWALGSHLRMGWRICALEQDPQSGLAAVDAGLSMWANGAVAAFDVSIWANMRAYTLAEGRFFQTFSDNSSMFVLKPTWKGRWALQEQHALYFWLEAPLNSVNMIYNTWARTRVEVPDRG